MALNRVVNCAPNLGHQPVWPRKKIPTYAALRPYEQTCWKQVQSVPVPDGLISASHSDEALFLENEED